ncbi:hypothetical protein ACJ72_04182 [Emergomyces africanus]|uniref:Uncharacterized protein n=1 Tax=Emergomyces africanus TaxID=1955775 RepID=A0A1B7NXY7_9EURO|nr:hypothetical protein ACJ72_04182 [Emergomyces africanus]
MGHVSKSKASVNQCSLRQLFMISINNTLLTGETIQRKILNDRCSPSQNRKADIPPSINAASISDILFHKKKHPNLKMKSFYTLALLIAAAVVYASPVAPVEAKPGPKAEDAAGRYFFYPVPQAETEDAY